MMEKQTTGRADTSPDATRNPEFVDAKKMARSENQTWAVLLGPAGASDETTKADLGLLVSALATKLQLTCDSNICCASTKGILTISVGLQRLGTMVACGTRGVLLYRQTIEGPRQLGDHFPTLLAAFMALLREGQSW